MKTKKELAEKQGATLGQLLDFVAQCSADGIPNGARAKARIGFRGQIQSISFESGE